VGCPCDWVIAVRNCFWYVLGTVYPRCVILSVTRLVFNLSTCHVTANTNPHVNANTNLIRHVLTLSAVHQWAGYLVVVRRANMIDLGI
jgi:hypothetical protein